MKIDFSQKLFALTGNVFREPRVSVVVDNLEGWMNKTYQAYKSNDMAVLSSQLEQIKEAKEPKELTLSTICIDALLTPQEDNLKMSQTDKLKLAELARRIYNSDGPTEINAGDEISLILKRLNKSPYGANPIIFEQADSMLNLKGREVQRDEEA